MSSGVDCWSERLDHRTRRCPWPGPRPLTSDDAPLLVGRTRDQLAFRAKVNQHQIVLLSGESGVGKSSLLSAGLLPQLRRERYLVIDARDWGFGGSAVNVSELLGGVFASSLRRQLDDLPAAQRRKAEEVLVASDTNPAGFFSYVDAVFRDEAVLVYDQFEELLRYSDRVGTSVLAEIAGFVDRKYRFRQVLSFRSEFSHRLRPLEDAVKAFTLESHTLEPVDPSFAEDLVRAPLTDAHTGLADEGFAPLIASWWGAARSLDPSVGLDIYDVPGTLHLQALLWSTFFLADRPDQAWPSSDQLFDAVLRPHLARYADAIEHGDEIRDATDPVTARLLFKWAMVEAINVKLHLAQEAMSAEHQATAIGARTVASQMAPHLSSAGYKLIRESHELARKALARPLGALSAADPDPPVEEILEVLLAGDDDESGRYLEELLSRPVDEVLAAAGVKRSSVREPDSNAVTSANDLDPFRTSSGRLLGEPPIVCLVEELRSFAVALHWMIRSDILRRTRPTPHVRMISLIHDGFGAAVNMWSETAQQSPLGTLRATTAHVGDALVWVGGDAELREPEGGGHRVIANVRWRGCFVRADFAHLTFANSDFSGTLFKGCTFEGVRFLNCNLDGVILDRCTIVGPKAVVRDRPYGVPKWTGIRTGPEFFLRAPGDCHWLESWEGHKDWRPMVAGASVYSEDDEAVAGTVVLTIESNEGRTVVRLPRDDGGLSLVAGRLAGVTVRNSAVEVGSALEVAYLRGQGLFLLGGSLAQWHLDSCAIRGVAIGPSPVVGLDHHGVVTGSIVSGLTVDEATTGTLGLERSQLVQGWDAAAGAGHHRSLADDCSLVACVGIDERNGDREAGAQVLARVSSALNAATT